MQLLLLSGSLAVSSSLSLAAEPGELLVEAVQLVKRLRDQLNDFSGG